VHWRIKGGIQKVLGYVPGGRHVHYVLQRYGGGLTDFGRECDLKVNDWTLMMGHFRSANLAVAGATLVEIGTGWYPTFPFCFYLAGVGRVHTYDLNRHIRPKMAIALAERLGKHVARIAKEAGRSEAEVATQQAELLAALRNGADIGEATKGVVRYAAPADAARTGLPDASVDAVFSNSVLEHIPGPVIEDCMREAYRIVKPGLVTIHSVNCGDHYAYGDRNVHQLNYLRYSDAVWKRRWDNDFLYQNRLRAVDFTKMAKQAGFTIELDTTKVQPERLRQLDAMTVDPAFSSRYTREELCLTTIDFVGRKPA
jgi:SAM-dependent methyltransferase